jgi:hypothetical protein
VRNILYVIILEKSTPEFRKKLDYFEDWLWREVNHTLRSRYELGLQVQELYEDERKNGGKLYGKNAIGRICKLLYWEDGLLRWVLRFVQTYTREDLDHLCSLVLPRGAPLSWSHVRGLIAVEDARKRQELLYRTVAEGWTCTQLALAVKKLEKSGSGDQRGRPPRVPENFDDAVLQQQQVADQWDRQHSKVWASPTGSLLTHAAQIPPEEVTEEHLHQAQRLAHQLRQVAEQAREQAEKAEQVAREFERILRERQQANGPARSTTPPQGKINDDISK